MKKTNKKYIDYPGGKGDLPLKKRMHSDSGYIMHSVLSKEDRKLLNTINNKLDKLLRK